jgi:outer membrane protein insertion porin family
VVRRELVNRDGSPYSFKSLALDRQKLFKLGLFTDIEIESLNRSDQKKDVLIKLKEGNAGAVEYGFGYADYEKFRGFAEVSYRNLWGMNRLGSARVELSSLEKRFILQYQEPWFMDRPLPFRASFLFENKEEVNLPDREVRYKLRRFTFTAGVEKKLSNTVKADLYYEFSFVNTSDVQPDVILSREDVGTLAISSIKPGIVYDTRDNPFDPSKGVLAGGTLKIASPVLLSETHFVKFNLYGSTFHRLHKRIVLAVSVRGGLAYGLGRTEELPIVERFFLGGSSSVRGYDQDTLGPKGADGNPTGGNAFLSGNIEFRTYVGRGISLVPFLDTGNVWVKAGDISVTDLKYTAGIGFRYSTPVGPLRVDYGFKLNREPGESRDAFHFSIGHAF